MVIIDYIPTLLISLFLYHIISKVEPFGLQKCNWRVSLFVKHLNRKKLGKRHIKGYKKVEKIKK